VPLAGLGRVTTAIAYRGTGARLVQRFKYQGRRDALAVLVTALEERARALRFDGIVPVPRHPRRVRELRLDPVHALARALAARLGVPLWTRVLRRSRATRSQTGLAPEERHTNVLGSFRAAPGALWNRSVMLLDDVTTTGATLEAAAAELRGRGGARRIVRLALAGTPSLPEARQPTL
jgi:predicted amidophosphoribosyltransferase